MMMVTKCTKQYLHSALLAVIRVTDTRSPTDDTPGKERQLVQKRICLKPALIRAIVALVANPNKGARPHVGVADHTLSITLLT